MWFAAVATVARLALRRLKRVRFMAGGPYGAEVGIGLLGLIGAAIGIAAVPVDASISPYLWAGCITFLLGVLVERIIQTAASRHRDFARDVAHGTTPSGGAISATPSGPGPVIDAEYTVVTGTSDVIEAPRSVGATRLRVKATIEVSGLAVLAILLLLVHGPPGAPTAPAGEEPLGQALTVQSSAAVASPKATDGRGLAETIEPFSGARRRDGLWLAMDSYFDRVHSLDDINSVFERRGAGIDLQTRFMSYLDLLRVGGSLRDDLLARQRASGQPPAARSAATAGIKFHGPCWKRYAQWRDGHRLEPWDIYDAAPGAGAEKNPWRAEIRQRLALCQAELASLSSPSPARP
jgi:hypothetical protein